MCGFDVFRITMPLEAVAVNLFRIFGGTVFFITRQNVNMTTNEKMYCDLCPRAQRPSLLLLYTGYNPSNHKSPTTCAVCRMPFNECKTIIYLVLTYLAYATPCLHLHMHCVPT